MSAVMSYRVFHVLGHNIAKLIHGVWHTLTIGLVISALVFIIKFHNDQGWGHLSSMHSWLGLLLLVVYFQNWLIGLISFGLGDFIPLHWKKKYLPSHRFLGIVGFFLAPVVMETGIAQKSWLDGTFGCMYSISNSGQQDNPGAHYDSIAPGCRVAYGVGLMVILNTFLAVFALWDFNAGAENFPKPTHETPLPHIEPLTSQSSPIRA
jgi:Eukaryotic cytochrome b561